MDGHGSAIVCDGLSKRYGRTVALDTVSLRAGWGEVIGLLGPNGAGKTTLIRVLTTVVPPTAGRFQVSGHDQGKGRDIRSVVGVLPESGGYPKRKRAVDHLTYMAMLYGLERSAAQQRAKSLLGDVGLGDHATDRIGTFSRGMRQRVGIARALVNEPRVLFLDEPTLGLDPAGQRDILELIARLAAERNAAVILTSHLLDEVERVADRIVILGHGRVLVDRAADPGAVGWTARVVVDPADHQRAAEVARTIGLEVVLQPPRSLGVVTGDGARAGRLLAALSAAGIVIHRYEGGRSRLMDEFLEVTGT